MAMIKGEEPMGMAAALVRTSFLVQAVYTEASREYGLPVQQAQLICVLMAQPRGMGELSTMLGLEKSSLTGLVDRAERRGLVCREPDPLDRRAVRVALSPEGARVSGDLYAGRERADGGPGRRNRPCGARPAGGGAGAAGAEQ